MEQEGFFYKTPKAKETEKNRQIGIQQTKNFLPKT